jgi:2-amino-4-hydroxy-6-hydroxymethyldihydropteridine diphosphokinase
LSALPQLAWNTDTRRHSAPIDHHPAMPGSATRDKVNRLAPVIAYVGLGANLGDRRKAIDSAIDALATLRSSKVLRTSGLYSTASMGAEGPDYLNAVAEMRTALSPLALLHELQAIEAAHGRKRSTPNAPRTLDLDLLLYGDLEVALPTLQVPHPRLHERAFVLRPLAELAPDLVVSRRGRVGDLLLMVGDQRIDRL